MNELETVLRFALGEESERYIRQTREVHFYPLAFIAGGPDHTPETWNKGKAEVIGLIESIEHHLSFLSDQSEAAETEPAEETRPQGTSIFIVHGHDKAMLNAVESFINRLGLQAAVLAEEANEGRTLIEKFEEHSNAVYAVALLSPDDVGRSASARPEDEKLRPRQNVVLEMGYFIGKLGRKGVAAIIDAEKDAVVEYLSDIKGLAFVPYDQGNGDWRRLLAKELRAARLPIREDRI
ncbi:MAG TPA: nucleotide-binding protein [Candidatus Baltobacteraceae bacterium]